LTSALVGYAVHNFFVFDNLYSYVYFFALLALIDSQVSRPIARIENAPVLAPDLGITYALPIAAVVAATLIWTVNIPGMNVATGLITALTPSSAGAGANIAAFQNLAAHPAFAGQEVREQLVSFAGSLSQSSQATTAEKQQALSLAASEMQKQVDAYPQDARERLQLSYVYRAAGDGASALKEVQAAALLSPKKERMWIEMGATEWDLGNVKAAQTAFNTAYALGPQFQDLAAYSAAGNIAVGDLAAADKILAATYGTTVIDSDILAVAYYRTKNWPRLVALWKLRAAQPSAGVETWFSLAAAYYMSGDRSSAIATINKTVALFPDAASSAAAAIKQIQEGTVGQ
jgi:tetratricopeptide (TPR) repeat protein